MLKKENPVGNNNPTNYKLKLPYLESLLMVEEWYDFGGHRIFINCGDIHLAIFDGELLPSDDSGNDAYQLLVKEIFEDFDGCVDDFIEKYEVQDNE